MGNAISSQRAFSDRLYRVIFYIINDFLFSGGRPFTLIESLYIRYFDSKIRQKVTYEIGDVVDYENPRVIGRNRRPAHAFLRAFKNTQDCLQYWSNNDRKDSDLENIHYITGEAGKPSEEHSWSFLLVGTPACSPENWEKPSFSTVEKKSKDAEKWNHIPMPSKKIILFMKYCTYYCKITHSNIWLLSFLIILFIIIIIFFYSPFFNFFNYLLHRSRKISSSHV